MNKEKLFPMLLRQYREKCNMTVEEVCRALQERGIKIAEKTLYGYENGVAAPRVNTFLALCEIYKIRDVLAAFGYQAAAPFAAGEKEFFSLEEIQLLSKFHSLDPEDRVRILERVEILLESEKYRASQSDSKDNLIDLSAYRKP